MLKTWGVASRALVLLMAVSLAACSDEGGAQDKTAKADQTEVLKSNGYVTAANVSSHAFEKALADHENNVVPKLKRQGAVADFSVMPVQKVTTIRSRLDEAIAREGSIPEIDSSAADYAAAIKAFTPVNNSLANYAESKGYLADEGKKARDEEAAYLEALGKVVAAEKVFFERIAQRDERLTRELFDSSPEGSVERYRAGIILQAKAAMKTVTTVFTDPKDTAAREQFKTSLNNMAAMVESWDKALRAERPDGCPALQGAFNRVIAGGRSAIQSAEKGRFDGASVAPAIIIQQEYSNLQMQFSNMIFNLNNPNMC